MAQSNEAERLPEEQQRLSQGVNAAHQASRVNLLQSIPGENDITYDQVMVHPDDPALNAAYARNLIRRGDLLAAATTLERLLLAHPEYSEARLIYGIVLYRLDDPITARDILEHLDPQSLPEELRAERQQILDQIEQRQRRLRQKASITVGTHFDSDKNASPNDGTILFSDMAYTLEGSARVRKDWGVLSLGTYEAEYDLGTDPRLALYGGVSALNDKQAQQKSFDTQVGGLTTGLRFEDGPWSASGGLFWNSMTLQSDYYLSDYGANGRLAYRLRPNLESFTELRYSRQAFHDVPSDSLGPDNSGTVPSAWVGLTWKPVPDHILSGAVGVTRRYAEEPHMSNSRLAARVGDTWLLGEGQFLNSTAEYGGNDYDEPATTFSVNTRRDRDLRLGLTYGVPTGTIAHAVGGDLPDQLNSIVLSAGVEYYHAMSNLPNYTYSNIRTQFLASKQWEF